MAMKQRYLELMIIWSAEQFHLSLIPIVTTLSKRSDTPQEQNSKIFHLNILALWNHLVPLSQQVHLPRLPFWEIWLNGWESYANIYFHTIPLVASSKQVRLLPVLDCLFVCFQDYTITTGTNEMELWASAGLSCSCSEVGPTFISLLCLWPRYWLNVLSV